MPSCGMPLTAGFLGKFNLFMSLVTHGGRADYWLAGLMAVNAAIAAYYYLRLILVMYFAPTTTSPGSETKNLPGWVACMLCAVATVGLFFAPQMFWDAALSAVR